MSDRHFAHWPRNLPRWASGLGQNLRQDCAREEHAWLADTPGGTVSIHFSPRNDFGVLDHVVKLTSGMTIFVPMRVIINAGGSDVLVDFSAPDALGANLGAAKVAGKPIVIRRGRSKAR